MGAFFVVHMTMCDPFQVQAVPLALAVPVRAPPRGAGASWGPR
ncbi:hypothetical protein P6B95_08690 [Streptomyces atratus]|nr:hypothetical protein [Streptomyces atratus]WPW27450.1 hypothetical protein P6B95_08690 [Streptomyces atratus]